MKSSWVSAVLLLLVCVSAPLSSAQATGTDKDAALIIPAAAKASTDFDVDAATKAYLDLMPPEAKAQVRTRW